MEQWAEELKNSFLRQTGQDARQQYAAAIAGRGGPVWDHVVLTASNEAQARAFRSQIELRLRDRRLPEATAYTVLPDPWGKRVGSGGATFNVLRSLARQYPGRDPFAGKRVLVIHSGGDSKRIPQYSAVGKLFSPVPRALTGGRPSTLFDEFMVGLAGLPARMTEGMLVLSGDVLLLFNPLQLDPAGCDALAFSMKEPVEIGKNHGVFLNKNGCVERFLHKQTTESLAALGAVDENGCVDLDTGAVLLGPQVLGALYALISTGGRGDDRKFEQFVNERARISFYGDFLYPLADGATLEQFYREAPEGEDTPELRDCRTRLWNALSPFRLRAAQLSPAAFIHFGTTAELRALMNEAETRRAGLGWQRQVAACLDAPADCAAGNALADADCRLGAGCYLENTRLTACRIGAGSIVSGLQLTGRTVPADTVLHGLWLEDGSFVARTYGVTDNPKGTLKQGAALLGTTLPEFLQKNRFTPEDLWPTGEHSLWTARLYPACKTQEEAVDRAADLWALAGGCATEAQRAVWLAAPRLSLAESFARADVAEVLRRQQELENRILIRKFCRSLDAGVAGGEARRVFGGRALDAALFAGLMQEAERADFGRKIRLYHELSCWMRDEQAVFEGLDGAALEDRCFEAVGRAVYGDAAARLEPVCAGPAQQEAVVELPVRVNWGGGWTDTPPQCMERGGVVLNAALKLNGGYPIRAVVTRLTRPVVELESLDGRCHETFERTEPLQNCRDVTDPFALHKAALLACGILPLQGGEPLPELLRKLGGGFRLTTRVQGIPKGSGLGTSSILAGACVKALYRFWGREPSEERLYDSVLCAEQLMSTGGGWQDQVGGLTPGVKYITTKPGMHQQIKVEHLQLSPAARQELQQRFALIYTGQRRLARNLLREVVGRYIGAQPLALDALAQMTDTAARMRTALLEGDIDRLAELFSLHWQLSKQLDAGCTNTCIEAIFESCAPLIDGRFLAGAGGGGFLQVILKKGVTKQQLAQRLAQVFGQSGVCVWDCTFDWEP